MPDPSRYREKVLYMPRCYIAVGGYEVSPSQSTRESLGVPRGTVLYYSFGDE